MKNTNVLIIVLISLATGLAGFFGGMTYQKSKSPQFGLMGQNIRNGNNQMMERFDRGNEQNPTGNGIPRRQNMLGFRPVNGEIIAVDEKSITVKLQDGSSKIILFTDTTSINKASEGTNADLKVGEKVGIFGVTNSDGSVTAQNIQLNPVFNGMMNNQLNNKPTIQPTTQ